MLKSLTAVLSVSLIQVLVLALSNIYLAKVLTVDEFAVTRTISAWFVILCLTGHIGLHDAVSNKVAQIASLENRKIAISTALFWILSFSGLTSIVVVFIARTISQGNAQLYKALLVSSPFVFLSTLGIVWNAILQATGEISHLNRFVLAGGLIPAIFTIVGALWLQLDGWVLGRIFSLFFLSILGAIYLRQYLTLPAPNRVMSHDLLHFAKYQFISGLMSTALQNIDIIMLGYFSSQESVAMYGLALLFTKALGFIPNSIGRLFFSEIAQHKDNQKKASKAQWRYLLITVLLSLAAIVALCTLLPMLLEMFYGEKYKSAIGLIRIMSVGLTGYLVWNATSVITIAQGRPRNSVYLSAFAGTIILLGLFVALPNYGAFGVAWAMNCSFLLTALLGVYLTCYRVSLE